MVAKVVQISDNNKQLKRMNQLFEAQQAAFRRNPMPTAAERIANLKKLRRAVMNNTDRFISTISKDFNGRSKEETQLADLMPVIHNIDYAVKNVKSWMAPRKKKVSPLFQPAAARVEYQPLGVVGIIAPWNYTVNLSLGPLVAALASGNRAMIKMSEFTPETSAFMEELISDTFPEDLVAVVNGDAEVATAFSSIPWNHLLFTGSTTVGRHVMRAASQNLTPVTLELGGKSPAIISEETDLSEAIAPIVFGKAFNAGQTCIAPDYVLCPENRIEHFVEEFQQQYAKMFPTLKKNPDYSSIINERQYDRLQSYIKDAREKGATVIECNPADEDMSTGTRKLPVHIILNATSDMKVMQDEIFGPILPVMPTHSLTESLDFINDRPSPLALYYFGNDKREQRQVLDQVRAGGVCLNDTLSHFAQEDMHFGGVGESGMGAYHGEDGFLTFSHAKSVFSKNLFNSTKFAYPPYGTAIHKLIFSLFLR